ncbi:DUF2059 domain-containing protein [Bradyrhizobium sp.]|uniref:DUF2059 domain-containing protein n=1 Tax=Bradyrhizobium sp. TaxID=376 RepID=UPI0023A4AA73|nr:DUF2059 domain-containing protein [Bradyrhizobium sp.]MDE2379785.1 DUF2059 domain-containing protein [Bradyrhizobium sp.]
MSRRLLTIAGTLLFLVGGAAAQAPSPETMAVARKLVATTRLADQYRAQLPVILLTLKPVLVQDRPELERKYNSQTELIADVYRPFLNSMIDQMATVFASSFTVDEMKQIEAFYAQPAGQKLLQKWPALTQQSAQIGQDVGRKAADELKLRLSEVLR